jgi:hypothetical protein
MAVTYLLFYLEICPKSQKKTSKIFVNISGITKHFCSYLGHLLVPKPDAVVTEAGVWKARIVGDKMVTVIPKYSSCFDNEHKLCVSSYLENNGLINIAVCVA